MTQQIYLLLSFQIYFCFGIIANSLMENQFYLKSCDSYLLEIIDDVDKGPIRKVRVLGIRFTRQYSVFWLYVCGCLKKEQLNTNKELFHFQLVSLSKTQIIKKLFQFQCVLLEEKKQK